MGSVGFFKGLEVDEGVSTISLGFPVDGKVEEVELMFEACRGDLTQQLLDAIPRMAPLKPSENDSRV